MGNKNYRWKKLIKKILILEGGFNEEHDVSLSSAKEVRKAIDALNYQSESIIVNPVDFSEKIKKHIDIDLCFNALHGPFGEDGLIQEILYRNKLNFTHSDSMASKKAFDKILTKKSLQNTEISFLKSIEISKNNFNKDKLIYIFKKIGSFVLKPTSSGSSYGVTIIKDIDDLENFLDNIDGQSQLYKNHSKFMIEPFINGRELTVAVYEENSKSIPLEVTEIKTKNDFFDYKAKYSKGLSIHILPAQIPKKIYNDALKYAKIAHDSLGCKAISRSDFIFDEFNQKLFFLEINTQPGLTPLSLVPEQLNYNNINFIELIKKIIDSASCQK